MRNKILLGNWKMNKTREEAKDFALRSKSLSILAQEKNVILGVAPSFLSLEVLKENNPQLVVSAQNVHYEDNGAFTGEISYSMLKDLGVNWTLIGHSERRTYFNETSLNCNKKILKLLANNFTVVYCVGETFDEFSRGLSKGIVGEQLRSGLASIPFDLMQRVIIAYEPVWSIGTGKNATKEIAEEMSIFIRDLIAENFNEDIAKNIAILYGGSVKPNNIKEYMSQPNVDGALVGGASLTIESFHELLLGMIA
jgi:triosephosphate isomerase